MAAQREWLDNDYYATLGVSSKATAKEVTKAYRSLAQKWHPDAQGGDEKRFKKVSAAYDVVGDEAKRKEYDQIRSVGPMAGGFAGGPHGGQGSYEMRVEDFADMGGISDILGGLFGQRGGRQQRAPQQTPGADVETQLNLDFEDALAGVTVSVPVEGKSVKVRIPQGVSHGQRIRLRGRGLPGRNGGPNGDLFVIVQVGKHKFFGRSGNDLTLQVPITFAEAALGAKVTVPTIGGSTKTLKIPAGTRSGRKFRVRGEGVTRKDETGDLMVTVEVQVPQKLSRAEKKAVETLQATLTDDPRSHFDV
jgi:molecular chaperone DnaJ